MFRPFQTVYDLRGEADVLRNRAYGVVEMVDERLAGVHLRPWPKTVSILEILWRGRRFHRAAGGNRCLLYYNQPFGCPGFLTLVYVVSSRGATLKTFRGALVVLDEIARLKHIGAIVCEASNLRISERLFDRWGWERHCLDSPRRHYIKRFYGDYPAPDAARELMPQAAANLRHARC